MRTGQLALALRLPADIEIAARLKAAMRCEHYRITMNREQCVARQTVKAKRTVVAGVPVWSAPRDKFCSSGQCKQGRCVLLEERLLERSRCPTCEGCGWIPRERA